MDCCTSAALMRMQWCPSLVIRAATATITVPPRAIGAVTGSRCAGALGRIPVECSLAASMSAIRSHGFSLDCGDSVAAAACIADHVAAELKASWGLKVKDGSRLCMAANSSEEFLPDGSQWKQATAFPTLGSVITDDGSPWVDFMDFHRSAWRTFFANCCRPSVKRRPLRERLRLLDRAVRPLLDFKCSRWPWSTNLAKAEDAMQKRMIGITLDVRRMGHESVEGYVSRRGRLAATHARDSGWWSERHRLRVRSWRDHLERSRNAEYPAARVYKYKNHAWLCQRRLAMASSGTLAGRLAARRMTHVNMRWEDGVKRADGLS